MEIQKSVLSRNQEYDYSEALSSRKACRLRVRPQMIVQRYKAEITIQLMISKSAFPSIASVLSPRRYRSAMPYSLVFWTAGNG